MNGRAGAGIGTCDRPCLVPQRSLRSRCGGFTYLAVLFLLALAGITATATAIVWRIEHQRQQEAELLFIGAQFARAIESYRAVAPNAPQPWPRSFDDLLRDPRTPGVRRHLRKVFRDPLHRSVEWGLVRTQDGGIVGVHSLSLRKPIRTIPSAGLSMRESDRYAGWLFLAAGAPTIVRDARSGMWMATGVTAPTPVTGAPPAAQGQKAPISGDAGAGTSAAPAAAVSAATPTSTTKPVTQPPRPRPNCSVVARNDQSTCAAVAQQFGRTDGDACTASAVAREAQCSAGEAVTISLAVRYF